MSGLLEEALALAFDRLGSGGQMMPFALVAQDDGATACLTVVTDRSDKAQYLGRKLVRERARAAREYAIATDAFLRRDGERVDAVIIETARRGEASARMVAQAYRLVGGSAQRLGEIAPLGERPSVLEAWDPSSLDWGAITPDVYVAAQKLAVHVVNHDFASDENVERTVRFLRARARHHARHLPPGSTQLAHYDDRGQTLSDPARERLTRGVAPELQVRFMSETKT